MRIVFFLIFLIAGAQIVFAQNETPGIDYSVPADYIIGGVKVEGANHLDHNVLITNAGLRQGTPVTMPSDDFSRAIKKLWNLRLFTNIQIFVERTLGDEVFLILKVEERPRLSRYAISGIKNSDSDEIRKKLNMRTGSIFTENMKMTTIQTIRDYYIDKGFMDVDVNITEKTDTILDNSVLVLIDIDKGSKVKIGEVIITGNEAYSSRKLQNKMKETREKVKFDVKGMLAAAKERRKNKKFGLVETLENLSPTTIYDGAADHVNLNIFKSSRFLKEEYESDKDKIIAFYNENGFRDAEITTDTVYKAGKDLNIELTVDEGNKYYFRNITWSGNSKYPDSVLNSIVSIKKGDIFNQSRLDERLQMSPNGTDVASLYMDDGYLFFSVNPVEVWVEGDSIDLEMRVYEGAQATINEVRIIGNTKTNEHVIRRELRVLPGSKFSRADLIRSQREIANLGYFDPEQMEVIPFPNPEDGTVDIEFRVVEKPSDQLELSAGWGGRGNGIVGTLGVSFTNFSLRNMFQKGSWSPLPSGDGQQLSVRLQSNGKVYQSYNVSFTEPWLGGKKPNSLSLSFFRSRFNDLDSERKVEGHLVTTGFTLALGTRLKWPDDFFVFQPSLVLQRYDLENWRNTNFLFTDGKANNLSLRGVFSRNSVDAPIYPRQGANLSLSLQLTMPYSKMFAGRRNIDYNDPELSDQERYKWIEYHKWRINAEWYTPLVGNLVFKASAKFGFLGKYNKDVGLSPFERFELGGDGISNVQFFGRDIISLRGYQVITPSAGAPIFNKFSMELRYPFSLNPSATIFGLAFVEGGNYWNDIDSYNPFELKRSFGLGLRVFLPMFGLLGFDYGIGFDDTPDAGSNLFSKFGEFKIILGFEPE